MAVVDHRGRPCVQCLKAPCELPPKDIFGLVKRSSTKSDCAEGQSVSHTHVLGEEPTITDVFEQHGVRMALHLRMPHVAMRVNEARRNNLVGAVDHHRSGLGGYVLRDALNHVAADQEIADARIDHAVGGVDQERPVLEEDTAAAGRH